MLQHLDYSHVINDIVNYIDTTFTAHFFYSFLKYIVIPFLSVIILLLLTILIFSRYKFDKIAKKKSEVEEQVNDFLIDLIFSNHDTPTLRAKIIEFKQGDIFQNNWCKYLILNKLIHIKENIKETSNSLILTIYKEFGLNAYSHKLIQNRKWYLKSVGFYHYQSLDYKIKKAYIKPYIESKNKYLRSNALIAMIALSDEKFDILNNFQEKISRADELKILDLIYQKKSTIPDTIYNWLDNDNSSIVVLSIKLIVRYRESFNNTQIKKLLMHHDNVVRKSIILAIRELYIIDAKDLLIEHYKRETNIRTKLSLLKTIGTVGDEKAIDFAFKYLFQEKDLDVKFEIVHCIHKIDAHFFDHLIIEDAKENEIIRKIVLHVNNPYLN